MSQTAEIIERPTRNTPVNEPIGRREVATIQLSDAKGGLAFGNMNELMDFAKLMAVSGTAVPKHLRMNPGGCMAVCMFAIEWKMSPFAVANKSYSVNDRLAFEAAMYQAVVGRRAPIKGRIRMEYSGTGDSRTCRVWATLADGTGDVEYVSPLFGKIQPKNSPLWKNDPDQQLFYFSVRSWARRHFPDVMMGIYTVDEILDSHPMPARAEVPMPRPLAKATASVAITGDETAGQQGAASDITPSDEPAPAGSAAKAENGADARQPEPEETSPASARPAAASDPDAQDVPPVDESQTHDEADTILIDEAIDQGEEAFTRTLLARAKEHGIARPVFTGGLLRYWQTLGGKKTKAHWRALYRAIAANKFDYETGAVRA